MSFFRAVAVIFIAVCAITECVLLKKNDKKLEQIKKEKKALENKEILYKARKEIEDIPELSVFLDNEKEYLFDSRFSHSGDKYHERAILCVEDGWSYVVMEVSEFKAFLSHRTYNIIHEIKENMEKGVEEDARQE